MKWIAIVCVMLILAPGVVAGPLDERFAEANDQYAAGDYQGAMTAYRDVEQKLAVAGVESFDLFFNMGCTAYRTEDLASARYWFERARRLKPMDRELLHNLAVLKTRLPDRVKTPEAGALEKLMDGMVLTPPYRVLAILSLVFLLTTALFGGLIISGRFRRKPLVYGLGVSLFCLILAGALLNARVGWMNRSQAVVTAVEVDVFSEPNTSSSLLFRLHAGTLVNVEDAQGGFIHISLPDGMNGWVRRQDFRRIN